MTEPFLIRGRPVPIAQTLGAELLSHGQGRAAVRFPVRDEYKNPAGQLQGGMYGVMMDMAMAIAAGGIATASLQVSLLRPATAGYVVATAEVVRRGRNLIYAEAEIRDGEGRLLARGSQTGLPREVYGPAEAGA